MWHKLTLDFAGPETSETVTPNPFTDYRLNVTFTHVPSGRKFLVPGFYAADGDAANTSAESGKIWRAHFAPDAIGEWSWSASFRGGVNVAVSDDPLAGESAGYFDGAAGSFVIQPTDKGGRDLRGKGRLEYVGKHHLRFAGTGRYFMKAGTDSPENLLAYADFDGDFKADGEKDELVKTFAPHLADWHEGDPVWQGDKGKGLIGAINYLASEGLNSFSFLTMNIDGDDRNVFPYLHYAERQRMDVSRLAQWEIVFEHGTNMGMYLHFKTQETENERMLDNGNMGPQRALYYRELIARFGHHLALNWNLGEEINNASLAQKAAWAQYFYDHDPYKHPIVIHNGASHFDMLGSASKLTGFSLQLNESNFSDTFYNVARYVRRSQESGRPWVVAADEPGDSRRSVRPDSDPGTSHADARRDALWATIMAGGAGCEFYFGYEYPNSDLTLQDFRSRDAFWDYCRYMLRFFELHRIPLEEMGNHNELISGSGTERESSSGTNGNRCLAKIGSCYLVQLRFGGSHTLDLSSVTGSFTTKWFNPRTGAPAVDGPSVEGGAVVSLGAPPDSAAEDWIVLVLSTGGGTWTNKPPTANAGPDKSVFLIDGNAQLSLEGSADDDGLPNEFSLSRTWSMASGPAPVSFSDPHSASTLASFTEPGLYVLAITAGDTEFSVADTMTVEVNRTEGAIERSFAPSHDAYLDNGRGVNSVLLWVESIGRIRRSYLQFDLSKLQEAPATAVLRLTGGTVEHGGSLTLNLYAGTSSAWTEQNLNAANAPEKGELIGSVTGATYAGSVCEFDLTDYIPGPGIYSFVLETTAGEFSYLSKEFEIAESRPLLRLTVTNKAPPVATGITVSSVEDRPLVIPLAELLGSAADPDGDPVSVVAVGGSTVEGGEVEISDVALTYTPSIDFLGEDRFEFMVQDGHGGFGTAELVIQVVEGDGIGEGRLALTVMKGQGAALHFRGVPLLRYAVERSTDLGTWETIATTRAAEDGQVSWTDPAPPGGRAFYRLRVP